MFGYLLLIIKFAILAVLYLFLYRVFRLMATDIYRLSGDTNKPLPPSKGAELVVTESDGTVLSVGDVLKLSQTVTSIGRGKNNNIIIEDSFASHNHARLTYKRNDFYLEDLGSINGTFINGVRINGPVILKHGDTIKLAGTVFKFARWDYEVE